jgi:predicted enzyme related to lactoylglutathione lyase
MKIILTSIFVKDQDKALAFYTETLGFQKKHDFPIGEFKWVTVVSPDDENGVELLLEPNDHPAAKEYQEAIYRDGIPAVTFGVQDVEKGYERLTALGVKSTMSPTEMGDITIAVFDDTVGNLFQLLERKVK